MLYVWTEDHDLGKTHAFPSLLARLRPGSDSPAVISGKAYLPNCFFPLFSFILDSKTWNEKELGKNMEMFSSYKRLH